MKYQIKINKINTVDEIQEYWTNKDYKELLEAFDFPDSADTISENRDLLFMAITDFEPADAATIVLKYKLADHLTDGQIDQISNDMLIDTVCEEYPEMELQATLFHINQLLHKAYNSQFPSAKATIIECSVTPMDKGSGIEITKEILLKLLSKGLSERNILKRLFSEQMEQNAPFPEAENIIWEMKATDDQNFRIITSENLLKDEDLISSEFEGTVELTEDTPT